MQLTELSGTGLPSNVPWSRAAGAARWDSANLGHVLRSSVPGLLLQSGEVIRDLEMSPCSERDDAMGPAGEGG